MVDDDGITVYMYGCAVSVLAKAWKHGEALRRWHNKETQIGTEGDRANESGGVLNPALLTIGEQRSFHPRGAVRWCNWEHARRRSLYEDADSNSALTNLEALQKGEK